MNKESKVLWPNDKGRFGDFGGRYVPETLIPAISELENIYLASLSITNFDFDIYSILKIIYSINIKLICLFTILTQ